MDLQQNLPLIIIAIIVLALIAFLLLRPRQRVQLSDRTPLRPHMHNPKPEAEGRGLDGEAAAATSDIVGEIIGQLPQPKPETAVAEVARQHR